MARDCPTRRGITLVEVLISIFVLGVGLLGVLSLFTAGRDVESRAARKSAAMSFADTIETKFVGEWSLIRNWRWTFAGDANAPNWWDSTDSTRREWVQFPVIIDPYALNADTIPNPQVGQTNDVWWWHRFVLAPDLNPNDPNIPPVDPMNRKIPFRRTSVFTAQPPPRAAILATVSDPDSVEYRLNQQDQIAPPENRFEFGRRTRAGDFTPALFIAQHPTTSPTLAVDLKDAAGTDVMRWLLIFHKLPVTDMDPAKVGASWPTGFLQFHVHEASDEMLSISVRDHTQNPPVSDLRQDGTSLTRALKPGQWMLFARRPLPATNAWLIHWAKIVSASEDGGYVEKPGNISRKAWLLTIDPPLPNAHFEQVFPTDPDDRILDPLYLAFAFESLMHVKQLDMTPHSLQY
jgi:type II secretory pathway pseudopilin PulG